MPGLLARRRDDAMQVAPEDAGGELDHGIAEVDDGAAGVEGLRSAELCPSVSSDK